MSKTGTLHMIPNGYKYHTTHTTGHVLSDVAYDAHAIVAVQV